MKRLYYGKVVYVNAMTSNGPFLANNNIHNVYELALQAPTSTSDSHPASRQSKFCSCFIGVQFMPAYLPRAGGGSRRGMTRLNHTNVSGALPLSLTVYSN